MNRRSAAVTTSGAAGASHVAHCAAKEATHQLTLDRKSDGCSAFRVVLNHDAEERHEVGAVGEPDPIKDTPHTFVLTAAEVRPS
jgi:hypothetical protein